MTMLQGLIFDAADVLYDASAWRRWLLQLVSRFGGAGRLRHFLRPRGIVNS